ncbi:MAG: hypothetical protein NDJ75_11835, partial [Thermoanaerobaculia bacterium]|nr:hypothetical protein [Thermoanaerobaculia bacterium]
DEALVEYENALRLTDEQLAVTPGDHGLRVQRALYLARVGRCDEATAEADRLERELSPTAHLLHHLARPAALCHDPDDALRRLRLAVDSGLTASNLADEDELASLRGLPAFRALVGAVPKP